MSFDTIKQSVGVDEFTIVQQGTIAFPSITVSSSAGQFNSGEARSSISHNLGYTPGFLINIIYIYTSSTTRSVAYPYKEFGSTAASNLYWWGLEAYSDNANFTISSDLMAYGASVTIDLTGYYAQYYLLQEKIKRVI